MLGGRRRRLPVRFRSHTAFFGSRGGGGHLAVLVAWAVRGYVAVAAGAVRARKSATT